MLLYSGFSEKVLKGKNDILYLYYKKENSIKNCYLFKEISFIINIL